MVESKQPLARETSETGTTGKNEKCGKVRARRHTSGRRDGSEVDKLSKIGGRVRPQCSVSELVQNLGEQCLAGVTAGHADPHLANRDAHEGTDFE